MKFAQLLLIGSVFLLPLGAHAQWQWLDKDNKKVFSDQAPPPDIPDKNILRRPSPPPKRLNFSAPAATGEATDTAAATPPAAPAPAPAGAAKGAGVDKELEEKTKKAEAEQKNKQAEEQAKVVKAKADNCALARQSKATVDSGIRLARVNAKGEREIMDDAARAAEQKRIQDVINSDCK